MDFGSAPWEYRGPDVPARVPKAGNLAEIALDKNRYLWYPAVAFVALVNL
jgi:hypothetical protein